MLEAITFDDVLIVPKFSKIKSRKDVSITTQVANQVLKLPVISSNMDTVTSSEMAKAMNKVGGVGCLHRFMTIEDNIKEFQKSEVSPWISYGLSDKELERAEALWEQGANTLVLDVAHGANLEVVTQLKKIINLVGYDNANFVVGNFGNYDEIEDFKKYFDKNIKLTYKVGIGGGSACTTRIETGCGYPTLAAILTCKNNNTDVIADGGFRTPGDIAKALAAGANAVMLGGMLAGTTETPGEVMYYNKLWDKPVNKKEYDESYAKVGLDTTLIKKYRGSASKESYQVQGKDESWRTAEGRSFTVSYKGPVNNILQRIEGGLRSAYSYVGANNTSEFMENAVLVKVTNAGLIESHPHGEKK